MVPIYEINNLSQLIINFQRVVYIYGLPVFVLITGAEIGLKVVRKCRRTIEPIRSNLKHNGLKYFALLSFIIAQLWSQFELNRLSCCWAPGILDHVQVNFYPQQISKTVNA